MSHRNNSTKATIIGAGNVGATIAYTLALKMIVQEIVIIDANKEKAEGEVMDLMHGQAYFQSLKISAGDYKDCKDSDYIIITAGAKQNPGETRLELTDRNKKILKSILSETKKYAPNAFYILVSNPVDILTYEAIKYLGAPRNHVFGTGTSLDTSRFKYLIGKEMGVSPSNIHAYIIGEHGDSSLPVISHAQIGGIPIQKYKNFKRSKIEELYNKTRDAAYEVISKKGATYYAIALVVSEIVQAIEYDQKKIIPLSTLLQGEYGHKDVCVGVPCVVGKGGIESVLELDLDSEENAMLEYCVNNLKKHL